MLHQVSFGKVQQICPGCHFPNKPGICLWTTICSPAGQFFLCWEGFTKLFLFFISLVWPPHLLTRSLMSWLGWAQLSSVELVPGVWEPHPSAAVPTHNKHFFWKCSLRDSPPHQESSEILATLRATPTHSQEGEGENLVSPRLMDRCLFYSCSRG